MNINKTIACIIRVISVPPVVASSLCTVLFFKTKNIFLDICDFLVSIFCLGVLPVLSYLVHFVVPCLRKTGREGQRKLAFLFSIVGYFIFFVYSLIKDNCSNFLRQISGTYMASIVILSIANKFFHFKMSGHASSISAPLILASYHLGVSSIIPGVILFFVVFWSSIKTKRHTISQFISGGACSALSFFINFAIWR